MRESVSFAESTYGAVDVIVNNALFRRIALAPEAIARAIAYAIEQPDDVEVSELIVRPTASRTEPT